MPEKTYKQKALKYKAKYYQAVHGVTPSNEPQPTQSTQPTVDNKPITLYNEMISMIGGNDTPESLEALSE